MSSAKLWLPFAPPLPCTFSGGTDKEHYASKEARLKERK